MENNLDINEQTPSLNNNYENIQNNQVITLTRSCKTLSISYLVTWISCIIFMIGAIVCYIGNATYGNGGSQYSYYGFKYLNYLIQQGNQDVLNDPSGIPSQYAGFIACIVFVAVLGFVLLMLGFRLISRTSRLKSYFVYNNLPSLFLFGLIFFGFTSVIGSILTLLDCSKIELKNSIYYNQIETLD